MRDAVTVSKVCILMMLVGPVMEASSGVRRLPGTFGREEGG